MNPTIQKFLKIVRHPIKFRIFLLSNLPAAFFSGIRIKSVDENKCCVSVPFKWFTQNPFKSTYFASLAMAAEMSTGVLAMIHVYKRNPKVSMLVTNMQASYFKKVIGKAFFTCDDGEKIQSIIGEAISQNESKTITVKSIGKNLQEEVIAEFFFTWSFKMKHKQSALCSLPSF